MVKLTDSELLFETFLTNNKIRFERIPTSTERTPDYLVEVCGTRLVVEVSSMIYENPEEKFGCFSRTIGDAIRKKIEEKRSQLRWATNRNFASLLLLYDAKSWLLEDHDYETAMYGERTILIGRTTLKAGPIFNGRNRKFHERANTEFSALGRICYGPNRNLVVTIFPNVHAALPIENSVWLNAFEVRQFEFERIDVMPPGLDRL